MPASIARPTTRARSCAGRKKRAVQAMPPRVSTPSRCPPMPTSDTRTPVRPNTLYFMVTPDFAYNFARMRRRSVFDHYTVLRPVFEHLSVFRGEAGCVTDSAACRCLQAPCECPEPCEGRSRGSAERGIGLSILSDHDLAKGPVRMAGRHGLLHQDAQSSLSGTSPAFVRDPLLRSSLHSDLRKGLVTTTRRSCHGPQDLLLHPSLW